MVFLASLLVRLFCYTGLIASDDLGYSRFALLAGALLFLQARDRSSTVRGLAAGLCFWIGYLTKEPVAFVAIAFFVFALRSRRLDLATQLAIGAGLVVATELGWYWSQTHDLRFRPHAMAVHNTSQAAVEANTRLSWRV